LKGKKELTFERRADPEKEGRRSIFQDHACPGRRTRPKREEQAKKSKREEEERGQELSVQGNLRYLASGKSGKADKERKGGGPLEGEILFFEMEKIAFRPYRKGSPGGNLSKDSGEVGPPLNRRKKNRGKGREKLKKEPTMKRLPTKDRGGSRVKKIRGSLPKSKKKKLRKIMERPLENPATFKTPSKNDKSLGRGKVTGLVKKTLLGEADHKKTHLFGN